MNRSAHRVMRALSCPLLLVTLISNVPSQGQGTLVAWGFDSPAGILSGAPAGSFTSVSSRSGFVVALRTDGTLAAWGTAGFLDARIVPPAGAFSAISAGSSFSVGIRTDGTLAAWGLDYAGQVGNVPAGTFTAVSAGTAHAVAIRSDGTLASWGDDQFGRVSLTPPGTFIAAAAGHLHSIAVRTDGSLAFWGTYNVVGREYPELPAGSFIAVAAGDHHDIALRADGVLVAVDAPGNATSVPVGTFSVLCSSQLAIRTDRTLAAFPEVAPAPLGFYSAATLAGGGGLAIMAESTPAQDIDLLGANVQQLETASVLTSGQASALTAKLATAAGAIGASNVQAAVRSLNAFIKQVSGLSRSGHLSLATSQSLIALASSTIDAIGG